MQDNFIPFTLQDGNTILVNLSQITFINPTVDDHSIIHLNAESNCLLEVCESINEILELFDYIPNQIL